MLPIYSRGLVIFLLSVLQAGTGVQIADLADQRIWWRWRSDAAAWLRTERHWHRACAYRGPADESPVKGRPACWSIFAPYQASEYVYFLHRRQSPSGDRRLTAVGGWLVASPTPPCEPEHGSFGFTLMVFEVSAVRREEIFRNGWHRSGPDIALGNGEKAAVYNGQPDPDDPSHFTIKYEIDGRCGTIDGWLTDDEEYRVRLRVQSGPGAALWSDEAEYPTRNR